MMRRFVPNPADPMPTVDDVTMAYRLILGREPESLAAIEDHRASCASRRELVDRFIGSKEFQTAGLRPPTKSKRKGMRRDDDAIQSFLNEWRRDVKKPPPTHWLDPLGVLTSVGCLEEFGDRGGLVVKQPEAADLVEWHALGDALQAAVDAFCAVELGAGFGPWLMRAGVAWRHRRGAAPLRLVGIEGEPTHVELMRQHAIDNDLADCLPDLHWGAIGAADGKVVFEVSENPTREWGTRPVEAPEAPAGMPRIHLSDQVEVQCWSLATLLRDLPTVDLLHVDIQGSEGVVLEAAQHELVAKVRRIFVGTHGRGIEAQLFELLSKLGFELREERACRYRIDDGRPVLVEDGSQYWAMVGT